MGSENEEAPNAMNHHHFAHEKLFFGGILLFTPKEICCLFRSMSLGSLAQNFEKLNPSENATAIHRVDERGLFLHYYQALVRFIEGPPL